MERRHNVRHDAAFAPVKVRNENDIILLRRTFQSVYQEKLREVLKSHSVDQKTRTAYILRLSQLENSLFENIKKHITVVREEWDVKKESKSDGSNNIPKSPVMEVFDKNLKRSVDGLEAKLQVLTEEIENMRESVTKKGTHFHSLADQLEDSDCFDENGELIGNETTSLSAEAGKTGAHVFNKEIYNSLKRKVSMINKAVEDLSEGMPAILANDYHDLKTAEEVLNAPVSHVDIAMQTTLVDPSTIQKNETNQMKIIGKQTKKKRKLLEKSQDAKRTYSDYSNGKGGSAIGADSAPKSPRTNLRDLLLQK
jgi:hypothetical protein